MQPVSTVQGALALIEACAHWLSVLTGLPAVAMSPGAGAHGELTGLMTIRAALEDRGDARKRIVVPESAHGTNPASAHFCGYAVDAVPAAIEHRMIFRDDSDRDNFIERLSTLVSQTQTICY